MTGNQIALVVFAAGIGMVVTGFATMGQDAATTERRFPTTIALVVGGAILILAAVGYSVVVAL